MTTPLVAIDADVLGRQRTGDECYVENLLGHLAIQASEVRVAAVTRAPGLLPAGIRPVVLPARSQSVRMLWRLPRLLRRLRPSLAHFQYAIPPGCPVPTAITVHDLSFAEFPSFVPLHDRVALQTLVPRSLRRAALVFTVSEWTKGRIVERYRVAEDRIVVTPNGVDPLFGPDGGNAPEGRYVLFVGAIQPRKDPIAALEALALLDADIRLLMVGPEKQAARQVREAVARLGVHHRVEFRGYVDKAELATLYRGALCLLLPSRYEGFGLPVLEAMACGAPVVATTAGAIPEVAGDAAVLVDPGDPEALADGVRRAMAQRERLRTAGLARAARFDWAETARRTLAAYREVL